MMMKRMTQTGCGLLTGIMLALLLMGMSVPTVDAKTTFPGEVVVSQNEFVQICRDTGGTPRRVSRGVVRCTYADGSSSTCNFATKRCTDVFRQPVSDSGMTRTEGTFPTTVAVAAPPAPRTADHESPDRSGASSSQATTIVVLSDDDRP